MTRFVRLFGGGIVRRRLLPVTEDDDDGVIGVDEDLDVRTAPLGVMSGAVVGVVTGCPSC